MAEMGEMESEDCQAPLDHQETKDAEENWGHLDHRERGGYQEHGDHREYLAPRGLLETKVIVEIKVIMETLACQDLKENRESRAHQQEEQCMFAGGGPLVPLTRELNYCTLEELEGIIFFIKEVVLIISVCQIILITCSMTVEFRETALYMELNIDHIPTSLLSAFVVIMFHVLCVTLYHETQWL